MVDEPKDLLYPNFLSNVEEYRACVSHWERLARSAAEVSGRANAWRQWIPQRHPNGTPIEPDGNPIFDGRSDSLNRGFRIIQAIPEDSDPAVVAWVKTDEDHPTELPRDELVIFLGLTSATSQTAEELLAQWMKPKTDVDEMRAIIANRSDVVNG